MPSLKKDGPSKDWEVNCYPCSKGKSKTDALNRDIVLPILKEGETWVFKDGEMKTTPLVAAETELQKLLDELKKKSQDILDDYVTTLTASSKAEINTLVTDSKNDIDTLTENSKTEILNFLEDNTENLLTKTEAEGTYVKNTLIASETERGIISGLDIRSREAAYILGAAYGDVFGTTLTSIEKGKTYYYWDSMKKAYIPYEALKTSAKLGGFITPDVNLFANISNNNLAKIVEDIDVFRLTIDKQEKLLKVFRYNLSSGGSIKTMNWVYNQIILFVKKLKYDLVNNTFASGYSIHQASNIQASYSTYYNATFICYQTAGNQIVNTEQWYFHTGEMILPII